MSVTLAVYFKDTKKYITQWNSPSSLYESKTVTDYNKVWSLPDGTTLTTNRQMSITMLSAYAYRTQNFNSTLNKVTGFDKTKCKLYMQSINNDFQKYNSSTYLGVTSAGRVNINCNIDSEETGFIYVVLDVDSGLPAEKYTVTTNLENITFDNAVTEIDKDSSFSFLFLADTDYQIDSLTSNVGTVSITEDKNKATVVGTATTNIVIDGVASKMPVKYTIDYSLSNITCDNPITTITENTDFTLNFSADTGFEITSLTSNIGTVTISEDKLTATITGTATDNISITGSATQVQKTYSIAYSLSNMKCVQPIYSILENTQFNLYFTANTGYSITNLTCNIGTIEIAENNKSATITGIATDNISIVGSAEKDKHYVKITGSLNNCFCSYEDGQEIDENTPCELIANNGYVFPTKLMYSYKAIIDGVEVTKYANVIQQGYRLNFDFIFNENITSIILDSVYSAEKEVDYISDFVNTYAVDKAILQELAETRFLKVTASTGDVSYIDMGQFIVGLYVLPLGIPEKLITSTSYIKMGYKSTSISASNINGYKWVYDLGVITIPSKYNNSYDYIKTELFINVPFFGRIELPSYLVGYDISVSIIFDSYSGNGTLLINNTFTNSNIETKTQKIVTDIPYIQTGLNTVFNKLGNTNVNPLINKCFIEVIRNVPYPHNSDYGYSVNENVIIGSVSGYCEFDKCSIVSKVATDNELTEIEGLLNKGVYIRT